MELMSKRLNIFENVPNFGGENMKGFTLFIGQRRQEEKGGGGGGGGGEEVKDIGKGVREEEQNKEQGKGRRPLEFRDGVEGGVGIGLVGFLTSSSTTRLYRGRAPRQSV